MDTTLPEEPSSPSDHSKPQHIPCVGPPSENVQSRVPFLKEMLLYAVKRLPQAYKAHKLLGLMHLRHNRPDLAKGSLYNAFVLAPEQEKIGIRYHLRLCEALQGTSTPEDFSSPTHVHPHARTHWHGHAHLTSPLRTPSSHSHSHADCTPKGQHGPDSPTSLFPASTPSSACLLEGNESRVSPVTPRRENGYHARLSLNTGLNEGYSVKREGGNEKGAALPTTPDFMTCVLRGDGITPPTQQADVDPPPSPTADLASWVSTPTKTSPSCDPLRPRRSSSSPSSLLALTASSPSVGAQGTSPSASLFPVTPSPAKPFGTLAHSNAFPSPLSPSPLRGALGSLGAATPLSWSAGESPMGFMGRSPSPLSFLDPLLSCPRTPTHTPTSKRTTPHSTPTRTLPSSSCHLSTESPSLCLELKPHHQNAFPKSSFAPMHGFSILQKATLELLMQRYAQAHKLYGEYMEESTGPDRSGVANQGLVEFLRGMYQEASGRWQGLLLQNGQYFPALSNFAVLLYHLGLFDRSLQLLQRACCLSVHSPDTDPSESNPYAPIERSPHVTSNLALVLARSGSEHTQTAFLKAESKSTRADLPLFHMNQAQWHLRSRAPQEAIHLIGRHLCLPKVFPATHAISGQGEIDGQLNGMNGNAEGEEKERGQEPCFDNMKHAMLWTIFAQGLLTLDSYEHLHVAHASLCTALTYAGSQLPSTLTAFAALWLRQLPACRNAFAPRAIPNVTHQVSSPPTRHLYPPEEDQEGLDDPEEFSSLPLTPATPLGDAPSPHRPPSHTTDSEPQTPTKPLDFLHSRKRRGGATAFRPPHTMRRRRTSNRIDISPMYSKVKRLFRGSPIGPPLWILHPFEAILERKSPISLLHKALNPQGPYRFELSRETLQLHPTKETPLRACCYSNFALAVSLLEPDALGEKEDWVHMTKMHFEKALMASGALQFMMVKEEDEPGSEMEMQKKLRVQAQTAIWCNLGTWYLSQEDHVNARRFLGDALRLDPHSAAAWNNFGLLLLLENQPEEAKRAFDHALQLDPELHCAYSNSVRAASLMR